MGISLAKTKKASEEASSLEEGNCMEAGAFGYGKISWSIPYENRLVRTRAAQGKNKGRYGSGRWTRLGFIVSLSILRCGNGIIKFIGYLGLWGA